MTFYDVIFRKTKAIVPNCIHSYPHLVQIYIIYTVRIFIFTFINFNLKQTKHHESESLLTNKIKGFQARFKITKSPPQGNTPESTVWHGREKKLHVNLKNVSPHCDLLHVSIKWAQRSAAKRTKKNKLKINEKGCEIRISRQLGHIKIIIMIEAKK